VILASRFDREIEFLNRYQRKRKPKTITTTNTISSLTASLASLILALLFGYLLMFILLANISLTRCEKKKKKEPARADQ
jgi:hypothetical protein